MNLIEPATGTPLSGIEMPKEVYWVLAAPVPLAGMKFPRPDFPWQALHAAGFTQVVSLHPGSYSPAPLKLAFSEHLEDLVGGGPPRKEIEEREKIKRAVGSTVGALKSGEGVVVHCVGGRGRSRNSSGLRSQSA